MFNDLPNKIFDESRELQMLSTYLSSYRQFISRFMVVREPLFSSLQRDLRESLK